MDLQLSGKQMLVQGQGPLASAFTDAFRAEGATVLDKPGPRLNILLVLLPDAPADSGPPALDPLIQPALELIEAQLSALKSTGWGRILLVGPASYLAPRPDGMAASVAGAALAAITTALAHRLSGSGVTVNLVAHGDLSGAPDAARTMIGRAVTPADVTAAALYLASPRADYVNAVTLRVDGCSRPVTF